jgi:VWFA-related protein
VPLIYRGLSASLVATAIAWASWTTVASRAFRPDDTRHVAVHATVVEKSGKLIPNLVATDFDVHDNGRQRPVLDVRSVSSSLDVLILLDASASVIEKAPLIGTMIERLMAQLRSDEQARIATFSSGMTIVDGERDQAALEQALKAQAKRSEITALWDVVHNGLEALASSSRRRAVLLVTDGMDTSSKRSFEDVVERAQADDVIVHVIAVDVTTKPVPPPSPQPGQSWALNVTRLPPDHRASLRQIAEHTGGGYVPLTTGLAHGTGVGPIVNELRGQYLLSFAPERLDGKVHDLRVRVARPDLTVKARRKFRAPRLEK